MKQTYSQTTITKKEKDWEEWGKLLKKIDGKHKSTRLQEMIVLDIKRLKKEISEQEFEKSILARSIRS